MLSFPISPRSGQSYVAPNGQIYVWDGVKWLGTAISGGGTGGTGGTGASEYSWSIAADDSTQREILAGETVKLIGAGTITTSSDVEGNITITGTGTGGASAAGTYSWSIAADDSTQREILSDETVKFIGAGGITTSSDAEGNITITGNTDYNNLINKPDLASTYQFSVAADDSTQRLISTDEVIKFIGAGGITTASDAEGNITITGSGGSVSSLVNGAYTVSLGSTGTLTVPANGIITAPINQEFQLQAKDTNSLLRNEINLDPNNGTYMSVWSEELNTSFSTGAGSWVTASWNNEDGLGAARFTGAEDLQDFWTTGLGSFVESVEVSINGGARGLAGYENNNGGGYGVYLSVDQVPPGGHGTTVPITSLVFYYRTKNRIDIDRDGGQLLLKTQSMNINLETNSYINLKSTRANPVRIITNNNTHMWEFDSTGSLTLPREGKIYGIGDGGPGGNRYGYISWDGNSSAGGLGYNTMRLVPDLQGPEAADTYIILDPAYDPGDPGSIYIRAGGTLDNSLADLCLGGANSQVKIGAGANPPVTVKANNNSWIFGTDGDLTVPGDIKSTANTSIIIDGGVLFANVTVQTVDSFGGGVWRMFISSSAYPTVGTLVQVGDTATTAWGTPVAVTITSIVQDIGAGTWALHTNQDITTGFFFGPGTQTITINSTQVKTWTFSTDKSLTFPDGTKQTTAWTGGNIATAGTYQFSVAADDSTQRVISTDELIKFTGAGGITTASDTEGNITITQGTTSSLANGANTVSLGATGNLTLPRGYIKNDTTDGFLRIEGPLFADMVSLGGGGYATIANGVQILTHTVGSDTERKFNFSWDGSLYMPTDNSNSQVGAIEWRLDNGATAQVKSTPGGGFYNIPKGLQFLTYSGAATTISVEFDKNWIFRGDGSLTIPGDIKSDGNINIDINLADSTLRRWSFGEDGELTVPGPINGLGNSKLDFTTFGANTAYLTTTSDDTTALIMRTTTAELYAHTNILIRTNTGGTAKVWTFGDDGSLTLPTSGAQIANDVTFTGNVTFQNTANYVQSTNTIYTDSLIELHAPTGGIGNTWTVNDGNDIGFRFHYYDGDDKHAGLFLDNGTWRLKFVVDGTETGGQFAHSGLGDIEAANFRGNVVFSDGTTQTTAAESFSFSVAADDSTQRAISNNELIKFIGAGGITTSSDTEGNITITGSNSLTNTAYTLPVSVSLDASANLLLPFDGYAAFFAGKTIFGNNTGGAVLSSGQQKANVLTRTDGAIQLVTNGDGFAYAGLSWIFDTNGHLTIPGNIVFPDGSVQNTAFFSFSVAADDSTQRAISNNELIKFIGAGGITTSSDAEGNITITGSGGGGGGSTLVNGAFTASLESTGDLTVPGNIRSEREINVEINLSDSTLRRWRFGEDGGLTIPGSITTTATTVALVNATATTVTFAGASTSLTIAAGLTGATAQTVNIATGSNTGTKTINIGTGGSTTNLQLGVAGGGVTTISSSTVVGSASTQTLYNTVATTLNFAGAATALNIGSTSGTITLNGPTVVGSQTTQNLYNTVATTVNEFGAATTINVATNAAAPTTWTLGNSANTNTLTVAGGTSSGTDSITSTVTTGVINLFTGLTTGTLNIATGGASAVVIGGTGSTVTVGNGLTVIGAFNSTATAGVTAVNFNTEQLTLTGNRIATTVTNANLELECNGTGGVVINSALNVTGAISVAGKQAVNGPAFRAYVDTSQAITSGSLQKVTFGTETFDTNNNFASSRFTPGVEGYYQLNATVRIAGASTTGECMITLWKNGSEYARGTNASGAEQGSNFYSMQVSDLAYANGTSDYFEIYIQQTSTANKDTTLGANISYFSGVMVRGA
jgi:hypothetical protein